MNLQDIAVTISLILGDRKPELSLEADELTRLLHVSQLKHFKRKLGLPEEYQPGQPIPKQAYELTRTITDDLAPFKVEMGGENQALPIDENGRATMPDAMYYPSIMLYKYIKGGEILWREVDILSDQEWKKRISSFLMRPSLRYPICNLRNGYARFSPNTLKYVDFIYIKTPTEPVYALDYTRGFAEYDSANSTELEWNDVNQLDIMALSLQELGVSIQSKDIYSYSIKTETTGL